MRRALLVRTAVVAVVGPALSLEPRAKPDGDQWVPQRGLTVPMRPGPHNPAFAQPGQDRVRTAPTRQPRDPHPFDKPFSKGPPNFR